MRSWNSARWRWISASLRLGYLAMARARRSSSLRRATSWATGDVAQRRVVVEQEPELAGELPDRRCVVTASTASRFDPEDLVQLDRHRRRRAARRCTTTARGRDASAGSGRCGGSGRPGGARTRPRRRARCAAAPSSGPCPRSSGSARPARRWPGRGRSASASAHSRHGCVVERAVAVRRELLERAASRTGAAEAARHADVVQHAVVVVEPEEQRADALAVLVHRGTRRRRSRRCAGASPSASCACPRGTGRRAASRPRRRARRPRSARTTRAPASRSVVAGREQDRRLAPARTRCSSRARRSRERQRRGGRRRLRRAGRSATNDAGVSSASIATRDAAGWMRSDSRSKSSPCSVAITISPSTTQRSGRLARSGSSRSGK